jgi:hypothetical protein
VSESLSDVEVRAPFLQESSPRDRHIRFRRIPRPADTAVFTPQLSLSLVPAIPLASPMSMAPALDTSFSGIGNLDAINVSQFDVIPPDTMGAAGPVHLVTILNSSFAVFLKATGALLNHVSMPSFWASLDPATDNASRLAFDPKVLYDTSSGRFVAITLSANDAPPSWIFIAVSPPSGPLGAWVKVAIDADLDNNVQQFNNWADYPGLGVDASNIYVTANMFNAAGNFQYSKVWVVPIDQLLNGEPAALTWTEIRQPPGSGDSLQPAHTFGAAPAEYVIREAGSGFLSLASITSPGGTPTWNDLGLVTVAAFTSTSALPGVPQFGNPNTIDPGDTRLLNAVYRNGSLWTTHNVAVGGKVEVAWYRTNPSAVSMVDQGRIRDPLRWYFYPSIAVNQDNAVAVGFSGSSSFEYASAYYTARRNTDPPGTMQPPSLLKTGVASYFKTLSGTENRWGDFSATVVDPSDNLTFWTLQEYAATPRASDGRSMWGTWWGKFRPPAISSPVLTATAISKTQVDLAWSSPGGQTGFRVERRQLPGGNFGAINVPDLGPEILAYTDNTGTAGTTYSYRVRALSAAPGPDSYSNEATAVTVSPPPPPPPPASSGGGGGGCGITHGKTHEGDASPLSTVLIILSPAAGIMIVRRRLLRISH